MVSRPAAVRSEFTIRKPNNKCSRLLGITPEQARERFGFLFDALGFGAPPHGGIALGLDRFVMLFGGRDNIRDCIAFPKTQKATDLMTDAPSAVSPKQLRELGLPARRAETLPGR